MNIDIMDTWTREAQEEIGNYGWREANQNAVTLAALGMFAQKVNKKIDKIVKPAWFIGGTFAATVLWWIVSSILGL